VSSELELQGDCLKEHPLAVLSPLYQGAFKPGDLDSVPAWLELLK